MDLWQLIMLGIGIFLGWKHMGEYLDNREENKRNEKDKEEVEK